MQWLANQATVFEFSCSLHEHVGNFSQCALADCSDERTFLGPEPICTDAVRGDPGLDEHWPCYCDEDEKGFRAYQAELKLPLVGPVLHSGPLRHCIQQEDGSMIFEMVTLSLFGNGMHLVQEDLKKQATISWSPFSLVQACRLHSGQADAAAPWLRLFKVSVFHHGATYFFAVEGDDADAVRARWVAEIASRLRALTQSLFPRFSIRVAPVRGLPWTSSRLLAGYLLLCIHDGVVAAYAELHAHKESLAQFIAYEDESCETRIVSMGIGVDTVVSERIGVNCSCFSFEGYHFTARSVEEKLLWLRAISNVKVKLRHKAPSATAVELRHYRHAILECARHTILPMATPKQGPLLPRTPDSATNSALVAGKTVKSSSSITPSPHGPMGKPSKPSSLVPPTGGTHPSELGPSTNGNDRHSFGPRSVTVAPSGAATSAAAAATAASTALVAATSAAAAAAVATASFAARPAPGPMAQMPIDQSPNRPCELKADGPPSSTGGALAARGLVARTNFKFKPAGRVENLDGGAVPPPPPQMPLEVEIAGCDDCATTLARADDAESAQGAAVEGVGSAQGEAPCEASEA